MLLVIIYRSDWDHGMNPIKRWYLLDFLSAGLTLPILYFLPESNYLMIVVILLIRGVVDQINRINKTVTTRFIFPKDKVNHYASFMQTGYHLGIGLAAISGIFFADKLDLSLIVWLDALTFIIAAILILLTRTVSNIDFPKWIKRQSFKVRANEYLSSLAADPRLLFLALLPPMTATFFQGTYSVLQPIYPIQSLGLGSAAVSTSYVLASIAIVLGSAGFSMFNKRYRLFDKAFNRTLSLTLILSVIACSTYILSMAMTNSIASAIFFTIMIILFEFIWMLGYSGIVAFAPKGQLGSVFGISFSIGCLLASVVVTITGLLIDYLNNDFVTIISIFMVAYLGIITLAASYYKNNKRVSATDLATE